MSFSPLDILARADIARPVFPVVLEATVKGTVVLVVAWGLTRLLRHASASIRHLIWTAGLAAGIEPESPESRDAAGLLVHLHRIGCRTTDEFKATLERVTQQAWRA